MASSRRHSVVVAYPHGGSVENCFAESLLGALSYDGAHEDIVCDVRSVEGLYIADNRDRVCRRFMRYRLCGECRNVLFNGDPENREKLNHCETCGGPPKSITKPEWLWTLDTDISFQSYDVLYQLLDCADPVERPIMSALYFGYMSNVKSVRPVWFGRDWDGRIVELKKFTGGVQRLGVVGMGCCLIHRSVFEKFGTKYAKSGWLYFGHDRAPWVPLPDDDNDFTPFGEDNCFCHRCNELDIPIYGNGSIVVEHRKKRFENMETFLRSLKSANLTLNGAPVDEVSSGIPANGHGV